MKYKVVGKYLIGIVLVVTLASCTDSHGRFKSAFEECMSTLEKSEFDYTKRVNMCKSYAQDVFYSKENK
jgi:hypothetical protein